jgi:hypothetical protein
MKRALLVLACTTILCACAPPLTLLSPDTAIQGESVIGSAGRVNAPFTFRPALYSATYPAGMYVAKFEDEQGVYFPAPEQLLAQTIAGGRTMRGGLYFSKKSWSGFRAYIDEGGQIYKFDIPVPVDLTVVKTP